MGFTLSRFGRNLTAWVTLVGVSSDVFSEFGVLLKSTHTHTPAHAIILEYLLMFCVRLLGHFQMRQENGVFREGEDKFLDSRNQYSTKDR